MDAGQIIQWHSMGCAAHIGQPLWGLGGNIIILLFSCDPKVLFGNGLILKLAPFVVGSPL